MIFLVNILIDMDSLSYPLAQLMTIKKNRFDQAIKTLEEKKQVLEKAYDLLYDLTKQRDEVAEHKSSKLKQLRSAMDEGETTNKIQQMKVYLKVVDEKLKEKEKKRSSQQIVVDHAQEDVDQATEVLFQRKKDVEKLEMHKTEWEKEVRYWIDRKETNELDEQGSATHQIRKKEAQHRKKDSPS